MVIAHRVNREAVVVLGWGRAILMQLAHPLVAAGVSGHSGFDADLAAGVERARRTIGAMLSLTFGAEAQIRTAAERINAIHRRVHGRLPHAVGRYPAGTRYDATDPALLAWVHATLIDSQLRAYGLFVGPLTVAEQDRYCAEATQLGPRLGVPAEALPDTAARLARYLREMQQQGRIVVGEQAQRLATALLAPAGGAWLAPARRLARLITVGLLPAAFRGRYGYVWSVRDERRLRTVGAALRAARRVTPPMLREWPSARRASRAAADAVEGGNSRQV